MKKVLVTLTLLAVLTGPAFAQVGGAVESVKVGLNLYGGGGLSFPAADLGDGWKTGYHGTVGVGFSFIPAVETVARYAYHSFPLDAEEDVDGDFTVSEYGLDFRVGLSAPGLNFKPYALVGAGAAKYDVSVKTGADIADQVVNEMIDAFEPKTKLYYCFGGGMKVNAFPRMNFFLEGRYTKISVPDGDAVYIPLTVGLNISL